MLRLVKKSLALKTLFSLRVSVIPTFNPGDVVYVKYLIIDKRKKKYFFKMKDFFGKCIVFRNRLFKSSMILRKAVKLNEVEQIFILDSPFILAMRVQRAHKLNFKKLLFLRKYSGKYSRVRLLAGFKKKEE